MMRGIFRSLLVLLGLAALAAGLWAYLDYRGRGPAWSCDSEDARREIDAGLEADRKYYHQEAVAHFERALEISPDCAMARLMVALNAPWGSERRKELLESLEAVDPDTLTARESFLVRYFLARLHGRDEEWKAILAAYLKEHPEDPYALSQKCETLWSGESSQEVEACYEHLLQLNPNWLVAQNRLGYLAMSYGQFAKAEDRFRTYRYAAPDQANPHDSLGELFVLTGRYDEAQAELEAALQVRPDFCASYEHLIVLELDQGEPEAARPYLERAERQEACRSVSKLGCEIDELSMYLKQDWPQLAERWGGPCHTETSPSPWLPHLAALMTGNLELARTIEATVEAQVQAAGAKGSKGVPPRDLLLLEGLRHLAEGEPEKAAAALRRADEGLLYRDLSIGRFKLYDRLVLAEALRRQGRDQEAERLVAEVASVNPRFAETYRSGELYLPSPR